MKSFPVFNNKKKILSRFEAKFKFDWLPLQYVLPSFCHIEVWRRLYYGVNEGSITHDATYCKNLVCPFGSLSFCLFQVNRRCATGEVRLAASRECVSPSLHSCNITCGPHGGTLDAEMGMWVTLSPFSFTKSCKSTPIYCCSVKTTKATSNKEVN